MRKGRADEILPTTCCENETQADAVCHEHHHEFEPYGSARGDERTVITVRAVSGLSGDMILAGLASLVGLDQKVLDGFVEELGLGILRGTLTLERRSVNHIAGAGCRIRLPHEHAHRNLRDITEIINAGSMPEEAKNLAMRAFSILADAEGEVHGISPKEVTFHEVGALDSILDICLACRFFLHIRPYRFICNPLPLADGVVQCAHGPVPAPAPAALLLLRGMPVCGFSGSGETVTPTALCLLRVMGADFGPWPHMVLRKSVISYGNKVFAGAANGAVWALGTASPSADASLPKYPAHARVWAEGHTSHV